MNRTLPAYVVRRICQEPPLPCIVKGSSPVIAFGDPWTSCAATLGLNPSRVEFLNTQGHLLDGDCRRLATLRSLGLDRLSDARMSHAREVVDDCRGYFQKAPYRRWFDQLEPLLKTIGTSYYDGTACHLDLVQWATDPTWGKLSLQHRRQLLAEDAPFLVNLLREGSIRILLLNGTSVVRQFQKSLDVGLVEQEMLHDDRHQACRLFTGSLFGHIRVVGWSTNIQSSFGVTKERRKQLAEHLWQLKQCGN